MPQDADTTTKAHGGPRKIYQSLEPDKAVSASNPFQKLPVETIGEILVFCLDDDTANLVDPTEPPLVVLQVCRRWRDIALSTPELWRILNIDFEPDCIPRAARKLSRITDVVDAWLGRARGRVELVSLAGLRHVRKSKHAGAFFAVLERHSRGFVWLDLNIAHLDIPLFNSRQMDLAALERLDLSASEHSNFISGVGPFLRAFKDAPRLRCLSLTEIPPDLVSLPGHQIDDFSSWVNTGRECLESLVTFPEMTTCVLQPTLYDAERASAGLVPITHHHIRHILLSEQTEETREWEEEDRRTDAERPPHIMNFLTLPALETIEIDGADRLNPQILRAFFARSSPPLQSMTFHPIREQEMASMDAFHGLDRLERLEVMLPSSELLEALCDELFANTTFLPNLTLLAFRIHFLVLETELKRDIAMRRFARVLKQRTGLCVRIQLGYHTFTLPDDVSLVYDFFLGK